MTKTDWVRKLTSRKFWVSVATFVSMIIVYFGGSESTATQVTALIMAGATVIAYVIGEGLTDAANAGATVQLEADVIEDDVIEDEDPEVLDDGDYESVEDTTEAE